MGETGYGATVYPRVCGGNLYTGPGAENGWGLSPRVRGKRRRRPFGAGCERSIPACAGETWNSAPGAKLGPVYPRVCGGNVAPPLESPAPHGSIPACAGETYRRRVAPPPARVYPRVCGGNAGSRVRNRGRRWSIPACAGETARNSITIKLHEVYPRVCGGN